MTVRRGAIAFDFAKLGLPLVEGSDITCPKCQQSHVVQRDWRPGMRVNVETGAVDQIPNEALYVDCPQAAGPIIVGMDGRALPEALELTPRKIDYTKPPTRTH